MVIYIWSYLQQILLKEISIHYKQSLSCVWPFAPPWTAACQASLSFTISWSLLKLLSIELMMPSNHLIFCHPLLLWPSIFPRIGVFSDDLALRIRWPNYWSCSISPSNEYSELISFRIDLISLLLKGLSRVSSSTTVQRHQLFSAQPSLVQLSHPYMTTGKTIALIIWTFVRNVSVF